MSDSLFEAPSPAEAFWPEPEDTVLAPSEPQAGLEPSETDVQGEDLAAAMVAISDFPDAHGDAFAAMNFLADGPDFLRGWEVGDVLESNFMRTINAAPEDGGISAARILTDRPDVLHQFYKDYYGPNNDHNSSAWSKRVGGDTPEAYAKYWYDKYGKWEGYSQSGASGAEAIDVNRLLDERPDVFKAFYTEFYGRYNDHKSNAWMDRVGGNTVEDYAKYWYDAHGRHEGYTQKPADFRNQLPSEETPTVDDGPSDQAGAPEGGEIVLADAGFEEMVLSVGQTLGEGEIFG